MPPHPYSSSPLSISSSPNPFLSPSLLISSPTLPSSSDYPIPTANLDLTPSSTTNTTTMTNSSSLSINVDESAEARIQCLISEHPVIIFSRSPCCMCHAMKKLLATIGIHLAIIELDDNEIAALPASANLDTESLHNRTPAVFINGACIGGLESRVTII